MRRVLVPLAAVVVVASLAYAVAPPRSAAGYADRASSTLELLRSQVQTVRLWIEAVEDEEVTHLAASVAFNEAEEDARAESATFAAYDPPDPFAESEPVRQLVTTAGEDTVSLLGEVRVAAAADRWNRLPVLDLRLDVAQARLQEQAAEVRR
ncbi:MAG: hypothetical protein ACR2JG_13260 [Geodermatophilaceae bacterium]